MCDHTPCLLNIIQTLPWRQNYFVCKVFYSIYHWYYTVALTNHLIFTVHLKNKILFFLYTRRQRRLDAPVNAEFQLWINFFIPWAITWHFIYSVKGSEYTCSLLTSNPKTLRKWRIDCVLSHKKFGQHDPSRNMGFRVMKDSQCPRSTVFMAHAKTDFSHPSLPFLISFTNFWTTRTTTTKKQNSYIQQFRYMFLCSYLEHFYSFH